MKKFNLALKMGGPMHRSLILNVVHRENDGSVKTTGYVSSMLSTQVKIPTFSDFVSDYMT